MPVPSVGVTGGRRGSDSGPDATDEASAAHPTARDAATRWALAARDGDPVAEAAFVRETQAELWRYTAALIDPDTADDLVQDTYLRAFRALPPYEGRASARTWLMSIARRVCADHLRTLQRRRRLTAALRTIATADPRRATTPDPATGISTRDLLDRLPPERRSAFVLTQLLGLSYQEAAEIEGVAVGTIRSRVARARTTLVREVAAADSASA